MESRDLRSLLKQYTSDGFEIKTICKSTGVPLELIYRFQNEEPLTTTEVMTLRRALSFIDELYYSHIEEMSYIEELCDAMNTFFYITPNMLENYLGLEEGQLKIFTSNPEAYPNGYQIAMKLMHLFATLIKDKEYI